MAGGDECISRYIANASLLGEILFNSSQQGLLRYSQHNVQLYCVSPDRFPRRLMYTSSCVPLIRRPAKGGSIYGAMRHWHWKKS